MNIDAVKSNLAHYASDAIHHGQDVLQDATKAVAKDVTKAASKAAHSAPVTAVADKLATASKVVAGLTSLKAISNAFSPDAPVRWILGSMGLQRRPSTFSRVTTGVGLIAAGAVVGAGVALLLSPSSGAQNRAMIAKRFRALRRDAGEVVDEVGTRAQDVAHDVENRARTIAHEVENTARDAVHSVEAAANEVLGDGDAPKKAEGRAAGGGATHKPRNPGLSHRAPKA